MPSFPADVQYSIDFKSNDRADLGIAGTPDGLTIAVSWNGSNVYGPTATNASGQDAIPVGYSAGVDNVLRVVLTDGGQQEYEQDSIAGQPGETAQGDAPSV